jgi:hypothetical protein
VVPTPRGQYNAIGVSIQERPGYGHTLLLSQWA